jgi:hypothetical protein
MVVEQAEILSQISQVMHDSAETNYEEMHCRFEYFVDQGDWSVDSEFSFVRNGDLYRSLLNEHSGEVYKLVHQLHQRMMAHTGGNWKSFELTVDATGRAHTEFAYEE